MISSSTISSGLNSLACVTLEDIIKRFIKKVPTEKEALITKLLCINIYVNINKRLGN